MGRIQDKVAIVTGGGDGIGYGICRRFAAEGAKILVAEISAEAGERVAKEIASEFGVDARSIGTDVGVKQDNLAMVDLAQQTWGTVDILGTTPGAAAGSDASSSRPTRP